MVVDRKAELERLLADLRDRFDEASGPLLPSAAGLSRQIREVMVEIDGLEVKGRRSVVDEVAGRRNRKGGTRAKSTGTHRGKRAL